MSSFANSEADDHTIKIDDIEAEVVVKPPKFSKEPLSACILEQKS